MREVEKWQWSWLKSPVLKGKRAAPDRPERPRRSGLLPLVAVPHQDVAAVVLRHQRAIDRRRQERTVQLHREIRLAALPAGPLPRRPDFDPVEHDLVVGALLGGGECQLAAMGEGNQVAGIAFRL